MAFKMNRPIIKGTTSHKTSVAKAKAGENPTVAPYSPHADAVLSNVDQYAKSFVPGAIDYGLDIPKPKIKKKKKKKNKEKEVKEEAVVGCMDKKAINYDSTATESCSNCCKFEEEKKKEEPKKKEKKKKEEKKKEEKKKEEKKKNIKVDPDDSDASEQEYYNRMLDEEAESESPGEVSDYSESKQYKNFVKRQEEENIRQAEELKRREAEASKARQSKVSTLETKKAEQIPNELGEPKLQTASSPESQKQKPYADQNPNYEKGKPRYDSEGRRLSLGGTPPSKPGYNYDPNLDRWTYNDVPIRESEVSPEVYAGIMSNVMRDQAEVKTEQQAPPVESNTLIEETTPKLSTKKSDDWRVDARVRRLDKLWKDSKPGGTVRRNMRSEGYTPPEER